MEKTNYCKEKDALALYEIFENEDSKVVFLHGFMSAIAFAYYKSLNKEQKELYCQEAFERIIDGVGNDLLKEFLDEHLKAM